MQSAYQDQTGHLKSIMTSQWYSNTTSCDFYRYRLFWYGKLCYQNLKWIWQVDPEFELEKRISVPNWQFLSLLWRHSGSQNPNSINFSSTYRLFLYGRSFSQNLNWFWQVDPEFGLEKRISGQNWSFLVKNDVTAAVRNRIWWSLFDFFVSLLCKIILSKFEVILLSRSRVWTWAVHFTTKFGHLIVKNDVTMAVRKQFSFYFFAKK